MDADNTNTSVSSQEMSMSQRLEQAAACLCLTTTGTESFNQYQKETIQLLLLLLENLSRNVMSGDLWALAYHATKGKAIEAGMDEQRVSDILNRIIMAQETSRRSNPMHSMF